MIDIVSNLDKSYDYDGKDFLSSLLHHAINIVPEADYGKICMVDENNKCNFIDAVGHDINILKRFKIDKEIFYCNKSRDIYISDKNSFDIDKIPYNMQKDYTNALKPIKESIYINITVDNEIAGRISLDIAKESNEKFTNITRKLLGAFATLASSFFSFQQYDKLQGEFTKELIASIIQMLGIHDRYTSGHSENVAKIAANIAEEMELSKEEVKDTYWAGMVHDIGKLLVPVDILNKKGNLTDDEYKIIKKHPYWGYKVLSKSKTLKNIAKYVLYHHERWDGRGYPEGLKEEEISLISQILAVADAWDAMTSKRAYREPLSEDEAIHEMTTNIGKQFSPGIAKVFLKMKGINNNIMDEN